ncbi:hypothetical protein B9T62_20665 [Paenibacillus donghaensis]|uniref:Heparinase n=2 Tax=Paenibacillus donghaensis TaxID=414771 RepID=A0A2Z2KVR1_9BACL|nr:hypothetical protein B9T62_20665 [Paenibacillus donghaensis]
MGKQELAGAVSWSSRRLQPAGLQLYYPDGDPGCFWQEVRESPAYQADVAEIVAEGQRLKTLPIPQLTYSLFALYATTGSRLEYERVYFERRRRLNTFALLALLEPENSEHLSQLTEIIWSVCDEYTWCLPAHVGGEDAGISKVIDLFSAETGFTLSEITLLLGERLPRRLQSRVRAEVNNRLFAPYLHNGPHFWETVTHNWAAVCAGSIGSAAMLLMEDAERLEQIIHKVQGTMEFFLQGYGEDGACLEGLGYWNYGFGYFVYYADLLRKLSGGELDWFKHEKVRSIAQFQQKCFLGGDLVANFSDSQPQGSVHLGLSHYLAAEFPQVEAPPSGLGAAYREDHCSRWAPALRSLLWRNPQLNPAEWGSSSSYLPDAQWLLSRHIAEDGGVCGFAAKGGSNGEPHNHNDLGQFILARDGVVYIADLGSGEYTAGYFGAERYTYDCNGSQGHAVPIIDGRHQSAGPQAEAEVLEAAAGGPEAVLAVELSRAYQVEGLHSLKRSFRWQPESAIALKVTDDYEFHAAPGKLVERFVSFCPPVWQEGSVLLAAPGSQEQGVRITCEGNLRPPVFTAHTYRDHFGVEQIWYSIDYEADQPGTQEQYVFAFQFV